MNVLIVEDETAAATNLKALLLQIDEAEARDRGRA